MLTELEKIEKWVSRKSSGVKIDGDYVESIHMSAANAKEDEKLVPFDFDAHARVRALRARHLAIPLAALLKEYAAALRAELGLGKVR